jgi:hypothetical protein
MTNKSILDNWEEEFDKEFPCVQVRLNDEGNDELVKHFIRTLLQAQREKDAKIIELLQVRIADQKLCIQLDTSTKMVVLSELDGIRGSILNQN